MSKRRGALRKRRQRGGAGGESHRLVAELGHHFLAQAHQRFLVIDQQHGLSASGHGRLVGRGAIPTPLSCTASTT
jgi:hypothetical protein